MKAQASTNNSFSPLLRALAAPALICMSILASPIDAHAISGGGKDYAEAKIQDQDFSGQDLTGKDFSGSFAQKAKFINAKLRGARFYKANLRDADFTGADLTSASLENAQLDETVFKDAVLESAYFSGSNLVKSGDITGADFSEALLRQDIQSTLCKRAQGTNPKTKVSTRDSLFCE